MKTKEQVLEDVIRREQPDREFLKEEISAGVYNQVLTAMDEFAAENATINIQSVDANTAINFLEWKVNQRIRSSKNPEGEMRHWFPHAFAKLYSTPELFDYYSNLVIKAQSPS